MVAGAGFGSAAWIAAGRGAGAIVGAAAGAEAVWARQDFRNSCQVWPLVVPFALAAFHWSPHCFITLSPPVAAGAAATGAGAGAAMGAAAGAEACWARQDLRNSGQVWPLVELLALAAFHWALHSCITLSARAAPVAIPKAAATRRAENATFND